MKHQQSKLSKYQHYLQLTDKERRNIISNAEVEDNERPNPQGHHLFPEIDYLDFKVKNQDDQLIKLATYRYPATGKPKAVVIMFHGLNSHIGHGAHIAHKFAQQGIQTVGFDFRGFGRSQGTPAYVHSLQHHLEDCLKFISIIKQNYASIPLFCLGQSMGGLTAYRLSLFNSDIFEGVILMAPAIKNELSRFVVVASSCLKFILPEKMKLTPPLYNRSNRNPAIPKFIQNDPYAYKGRAKLATMNFLLKQMDLCPKTFKDYRCPFLIIQGGLDKSVDPMGAFQLFKESPLSEQDKDILLYEQMWHDIWHQPEIYQITEEIIKWIAKRVQKRNICHRKQNEVIQLFQPQTNKM